MNKVLLIGHIGQDPKIFEKESLKVVSFSIATNEKWKQGDEEKKHTEWHNIVVFGKLAEVCQRYLKKGMQVYIEGKIRSSKFKDKEGNEKTKYDIICSELQILDWNDREKKNESQHSLQPTESQVNDLDDDIPF